ncbi:hypothetical protein Tco_0677319 [Tanacetum coccineum]|uniref:Uncharacterized protein n=1 Tax=Tanacetum coccineum TaxID=301880 RepID=A0ABQ4XD10_9ASTR
MKDCPQKEEGKTLEEAYYIQFGAPYQYGGQYRAAGPRFYQRNNGNSSYPDRRPSLEESLTKFMVESTKNHEENSNIIKEIRASTDAAIRNQGAAINTLEIQIEQISKVLQERGFGSLPSSMETNPRDQVKSISTAKDDFSKICRIRCGSYTAQDVKILDAYDHTFSHKEKDPGSFTLPCFIHNICFDKALVDLGASRESIRRIQDIESIQYSGRYQAWSLLQEIPNTPYPTLGYALNTAYPLPSDMAYPTFCPIQLRMTKVIKGEFEKIKDVKVEDVLLTCDASLEVFNDEVSRLSKMDDDLFTYEVEVANIPCDSKMDNDSEQLADDDMGYDPSDIKGDDEVELTDEESSDNNDEIAEVFRIDTNIFDYETPLCSAFNEFNYLLKVDLNLLTKDIMGFKTYEDYKDDWIYEWNKGVLWDYEWYEALEDCKIKDEALRNKAIMEGSIKKDDDESRY